MRSLRWLLFLSGILFLQYTALADSCPLPQGNNAPPPGATQGPYTLTLCVDPSVVIENGPLGTETFQIQNNLIFWGDELSLALNDNGQWALTTGGGTSDPGTLYGQYTGPITVAPIDIPNGQIGCRSTGIQPGGTLVGDDGNLGYSLTAESLGFPQGDCVGTTPRITGITDQGQVSAAVAYHVETVQGQQITGSVDYTWNFAETSTVPEPATLVLLIPGLLALAAFRLKKAAA
jgi:hypothetical protein